MNHQLVASFFERGVLLSPEIVEQVGLHHLDTPDLPLVLTTIPTGPRVDVPTLQSSLSVQDIAHYYQEKYRGIQTLLGKKLTPVSISHAGKLGDVSIIGLVRERTPAGFLADDVTGTIEVVGTAPAIGDVVGIQGTMREGKLIAREILYPDIPLPKEAVARRGTYILSTVPVTDGYSIVYKGAGTISVPESPAKITLPTLSLVVVEANGNPVEWLKKRHLPDKITSPKDHGLLDGVPDILWVIGESNKQEHYKGVWIISTLPGSSARVDAEAHTVTFSTV